MLLFQFHCYCTIAEANKNQPNIALTFSIYITNIIKHQHNYNIQFISNEKQLIGFYVIQIFIKKIFEKSDFM